MPMYDFKCNDCDSIYAYHINADTYDNDSRRVNCMACTSTNMERLFGNQSIYFSGMFNEITIGGQTFTTAAQKKAFEKENNYIPLSYEENQQETTKNRKRIEKQQQEQMKSDVTEICKKAFHKNGL